VAGPEPEAPSLVVPLQEAICMSSRCTRRRPSCLSPAVVPTPARPGQANAGS